MFAVDFHFHATSMLESGVLQNNLVICAIVCLTVFFAIVIANIVGTLLPIGAKRLGFDPAVMASPFITTIVDAISLIIYFSVATSVLGI